MLLMVVKSSDESTFLTTMTREATRKGQNMFSLIFKVKYFSMFVFFKHTSWLFLDKCYFYFSKIKEKIADK